MTPLDQARRQPHGRAGRPFINVETKRDFGALILIASVSAVIAYGYFTRVDWPNFDRRLILHHDIITGTAAAPFRYRILVPVVIEPLYQALSLVLPAKTSFLLVYAVFDLAAIFFLLASLFSWLRTWFDRQQALVGALFAAGTMPIALQDHYYAPWSLLDAGLFTMAMLAIHGRRHWLVTVLLLISALNRETAVLIPLAYLATIDHTDAVGRRKTWLLFGGWVSIWAAVFLGLRYVLGPAPSIELASVFAFNISRTGFLLALLNGSLFLGGFWLFALLGFRHAPRPIQRLTWIIPVYLAVILVWGVWYEVRLLMPMYPILLGLGLSFLYRREPRSEAHG